MALTSHQHPPKLSPPTYGHRGTHSGPQTCTPQRPRLPTCGTRPQTPHGAARVPGPPGGRGGEGLWRGTPGREGPGLCLRRCRLAFFSLLNFWNGCHEDYEAGGQGTGQRGLREGQAGTVTDHWTSFLPPPSRLRPDQPHKALILGGLRRPRGRGHSEKGVVSETEPMTEAPAGAEGPRQRSGPRATLGRVSARQPGRPAVTRGANLALGSRGCRNKGRRIYALRPGASAQAGIRRLKSRCGQGPAPSEAPGSVLLALPAPAGPGVLSLRPRRSTRASSSRGYSNPLSQGRPLVRTRH